ncbi:aureocin A53 family class IId bacteriocin [Bacillus paramycoides]|nr:aureocin A53 family class IId bacteriocin [Bacillus paramycoides]
MMAFLKLVGKLGPKAAKWAWANKGKVMDWITQGMAIDWIIDQINRIVG